MKIASTITALRETLYPWQKAGRLGFVATMGNLHAGHLALVHAAQQQTEKVVVSIFVNPLQFGPKEDFGSYPRTLEDDLEKLEKAGVDGVFTPSVETMYGTNPNQTRVSVPVLSDLLCGLNRPGHFEGVATVVTKLFHLIEPHYAFFGQKDYQQLTVIRQMVADLNFPIVIEGVPTVREASGLALSSRNRYLSVDELVRAPRLHQMLKDIRRQLSEGRQDYAALEQEGMSALVQAGFRPDYVAIRRCEDLSVPQEGGHEGLIILAAAFLGKTRLIDNVKFE